MFRSRTITACTVVHCRLLAVIFVFFPRLFTFQTNDNTSTSNFNLYQRSSSHAKCPQCVFCGLSRATFLERDVVDEFPRVLFSMLWAAQIQILFICIDVVGICPQTKLQLGNRNLENSHWGTVSYAGRKGFIVQAKMAFCEVYFLFFSDKEQWRLLALVKNHRLELLKTLKRLFC